MMIANGNALTMVMVCSALKPPANNSTDAMAPSSTAQKIRCQAGVSSTPPDARESTTSEPESDDVTKKVTIRHTARNDTSVDQGK